MNRVGVVCAGVAGGVVGYCWQVPSRVVGGVGLLGMGTTLAAGYAGDKGLTQYCRLGWWLVCFCLGSWLVRLCAESQLQPSDTEGSVASSDDGDGGVRVAGTHQGDCPVMGLESEIGTGKGGDPLVDSDRASRSPSAQAQSKVLRSDLRFKMMDQNACFPELRVNQYRIEIFDQDGNGYCQYRCYVCTRGGQHYGYRTHCLAEFVEQAVFMMHERLLQIGLASV